MAAFKLIIFLAISMAFVMSVRCQDEFNEEIETGLGDRTSDVSVSPGLVNGTTPDGKGGFINCVKEKVKKVVDRGKQVVKAAGEAISKGYNDFKAKAKDIIGKKQPESMSPSSPKDPNQNQPTPFSPSESYPYPSAPIPGQGQQNSRTEQSTSEDPYELIDQRNGFKN
ncbi:uncharacterized protein LOC135835555 [Planococcus citri]|uniref:uncharacterized protein LOC135835555 n=1 Tax=Planococcus citri TaxID=170843 RepID=UPI0031F98845